MKECQEGIQRGHPQGNDEETRPATRLPEDRMLREGKWQDSDIAISQYVENDERLKCEGV